MSPRRRRAWLGAAALSACCAGLLAAPAVHAQGTAAPPEQNRFTRKILVDGLDEPVQLEFDRAGRVYWIERRGVVKRFDESKNLVTTLGTLPVAYEGEAGLIGLLLDRDFERTRHIYLYYSIHVAPDTTREMRLSRVTLSTRDSIDRASEVVLMRWPYDLALHFGGGMTWDAQGNLYLTTGDNSDAQQYSTTFWTNPGGRGQDAQRTSGNSNDLRGKILRIHPEPDGTYTVPSGNLFPPGTPNTRPETYTMGNRNPWRVSIDSRTGYLHWGEVGPDAGADSAGVGPMGYDEMNVATGPGNFGWPYFIGDGRAYPRTENGPPRAYGPPRDPERPVNDSPNNTGIRDLPPARRPALAYPYGVSEQWPVLGSGGRCMVGGPVFRGASFAGAARPFPEYYEGKWFVVDWVRMWIMVATLSEDRTRVVGVERFLPDEKLTAPLDIDFGPSGDLYLVEYGLGAEGKLTRVEYNAGNRAPRVVATADRLAGAVTFRVALSARGTADPDGDPLRYQWTLTPSGGAARRYAAADTVVTLATPGMYTAVLTATDSAGLASRDSVRLVAGNEPPRVALAITRGNRSFYFPGRTVEYRATIADREDQRVASGVSRARTAVVADFVPVAMTPDELARARDVGPTESLRHTRALAIMARSDCAACHRTDARLVGPSFREIARRYRGQDVGERIAQKIIAGGGGVWGELSMTPHPGLTPTESRLLAQYILSLTDTGARPRRLPLAGRFAPPDRPVRLERGRPAILLERGAWVLRASYADAGANGVAPLAGSAAVQLRHPLLAPESADSVSSGITFAGSNGDPSFTVRRSGAHFAFRGLDLTGVATIEIGALTRFYTWSHFKGATIELRLDSATGRLAGPPATLVPPPPRAAAVFGDDLEKPVSVRLENAAGVHDVYFVFTNAEARPDDDLLLLTHIELTPVPEFPSGPAGSIPFGFTRLFNGRDLTGWHVSRTTHQGTTPDVQVENGAIVLRQRPYGQGGLLLTNRKYRDFELYLEAKPDSGTNGGIFFRSTEGGSAYQVEMAGDGAPGTGSLFGEMLRVASPVRAEGVAALWRPNDWNALRLRVQADTPHVTLWINGVQVYDTRLRRNDLIADRTDGFIALQSHWSSTVAPTAGAFDMSESWKPGAAHRYRNIAIRELPRGGAP